MDELTIISPVLSQKRTFIQSENEDAASGSTSNASDSVSQIVEPDAKRLCTDVCSQDPSLPSSPVLANPQLAAAGPPQRRRVNPESLAARLGPELVAELEKHITPGDIEMPPFSVRRDIQVKFGIDRRHIYDFFHSRGLRCLKDEKAAKKDHMLSPEFRFRPPRQLATPPSPKFSAMRKRRAATAAIASLSKTTTTRAPRKARTLPIRPVVTEPAMDMDDDDDDSRIPFFAPYSSPSHIELTEEDMFADFIPVANPLDETFSLERALGDVSYAYRSRPVFERMLELQELSSLASTPPLTPSNSVSSFLSSPNTASGSPTVSATPDLSTQPKSVTAPLSQAEREGYYGWIAGVLGPAAGIQENIGTYKSYMEKQRGIYFERLIMSDGRSNSVQSANAASKGPSSGGDFRNWVMRSKPDVSSRMLPATTSVIRSTKDDSLDLDDLIVSDASCDDLEVLFPDLDLEYPTKPEEHPDSPVYHMLVTSKEKDSDAELRLPWQSTFKRKFGLKSEARSRCITGCSSYRRKRKMSSLPVIDQDWTQHAHRRTYSMTGEM